MITYQFHFDFNDNGEHFEQEAHPVWGDSLGMVFQRESGEQFIRPSLNGPLLFIGADYDLIAGRSFDCLFEIELHVWKDGALQRIYPMRFFKTDCEFNEDDKSVSVTPEIIDSYNQVMAGIEREFDLIKLKPVIEQVQMDKRPVLQVYIGGSRSVGCFLSGMWWESPVISPTSDDNLLVNTYKFTRAAWKHAIYLEGTPDAIAIRDEDVFLEDMPADPRTPFDLSNGNSRITMQMIQISGGYRLLFQFYRSGVLAYEGQIQPPQGIDYSVVLQPTFGYYGTITLTSGSIAVYTRMITDADEVDGIQTDNIPASDLVENNRNYSKILRVMPSMGILFGLNLSSTPTEYGVATKYYGVPYYYTLPPSPVLGKPVFPVARNDWGRVSVWFVEIIGIAEKEVAARVPVVLRDAFPLWSVISVLLQAIGADTTHAGTEEYSEFLYGENPISGTDYRVLLTPKSNLISINYDEPAQSAPISLLQVLNMLRDMYRCYWYIDEDDRFRIEHISFFRNGGSYDSAPGVGLDLTTTLSRNGKSLAFGTSRYTFDKDEMPARYEFGWMDKVSAPFEGYPISMKSNYVKEDLIERVSLSRFTSDIDYILLDPGEVSKDGFGVISSDEGVVPYMTYEGVTMQNGYLSFAILEGFYLYDLPGRRYEIDGIEGTAIGVKRQKVQRVSFPVMGAPDFLGLVKTFIGNGTIRKIELNLSSRMAETDLEYDTDE